MKVLLITVRSDFGGGPRHVDQLVKRLPQDIEIYMAFPAGGEPYADKWDNDERIKGIVHIPYRSFSLSTLKRLRKYVIDEGIDIVHSHGNGAGLYSRIMRKMGCQAKIVHTFHGITDNYSSHLKGMAMLCVNRMLRGCADAYVLVSKGEYKLGKEMGYCDKKNSHVIYNGIERPKLSVVKRKGFNVVTLSRFDYQKNMDLCYDIASNFKDKSDIRFVWVGDGTDKERLEQKAKSEGVNIEFVGFSNKPLEELASSSIYLSTSRFEGLPYALIEASSVGLPIVATNVVGNNECVIDGKNGYLYDTLEKACDYIDKLYSDSMLTWNMSKAAIKMFEDNFTEDMMIKKISELYGRLL